MLSSAGPYKGAITGNCLPNTRCLFTYGSGRLNFIYFRLSHLVNAVFAVWFSIAELRRVDADDGFLGDNRLIALEFLSTIRG